MDLRQKGSWDEVWSGLIDPEAREQLKRSQFMARRKSAFEIMDFEIVSTDETGEAGSVVARMDTMMTILEPGGGRRRIPREMEDTQEWILRDGRWYIRLTS